MQEEKEEAGQKILEAIHARIGSALAGQYHYSDIAILVRKNVNGNKIANYLLQKGIPVISSDSLLLKNCPEVNFVNAFLAWLINPNDAVAAVSIITYLRESSHPSVTLETIQQVSREPYRLKETLKQYGIEMDLDHAVSLSLYELCTGILRVCKLEDKNPLYLNFFLDEVSDFSQRESNSVFEFLSWWKQKSDKLSVKIPANTNAVKVLTIHSSKGLEFPVVIFPFADWKTDSIENILIDTEEELPQLPVALVPTGSTLKKTRFKELSVEEEQKQKLDNLNLLYVACTRAADELHIVARENSRGGKTIATWLRDFVREKYQLPEGNLEVGSQPAIEHKPVKDVPELKPAKYRPLHQAVKIKLSDYEDSASSRRLFGIALHNILAEIKTREDIEVALQKAILQGNINAEQLPVLQSTIQQLTADQAVAPYFSNDVRIKTETELFLNTGEVIRPDRVVICSDHLAVIDFKTGEKKAEHLKQIEQYRYALKNISGQEVKAFLVYFPLEIVAV